MKLEKQKNADFFYDSILELIKLHQDKDSQFIAYALVLTGACFAKISAPCDTCAQHTINNAILDSNGDLKKLKNKFEFETITYFKEKREQKNDK